MSTIWSRTDGANGPSLSIIFSDGEVALLGKDHLNLNAITVALAAGDVDEKELRELINPAKSIATRFHRLSERITTDGVHILLDGDVLNDGLTDYILELIRLENEGDKDAPSWKPFVNFLEKLSQNTSKESRESLYDFVTKWGLTIRNDGDFIAYKGIQDNYGSVQQGPGIVNNVRVNGHLDNHPGNLVEIERSYVEANRNLACAQGLHVTTIGYASGWGPRVVAVAVNPRDVVSVPLHEIAKMRVCRYEVLIDVPNPKRDAERAERVAPLWTGAQRHSSFKTPEALAPKLLKKIEKAIEKKSKLVVTYKPVNGYGESTYTVIPKRITGDLLRLNLPGNDFAIRDFVLTSITSVKKVDSDEPKAKNADKPVKVAQVTAEAPAEKIVKAAIAEGKLVNIKYKPTEAAAKTYLVKPLSIEDGKLRLLLPGNGNARRDFIVKSIVSAEAHRESKKNKGNKN